MVKNKLVKLPVDINEPQLQLLNTLLNTSFAGQDRRGTESGADADGRKAAGSAYGLISLVVSFAMEVLEDVGRSSVHTAGANRILEHTEYQDVDKAHELLSYLDHDAELAQLPGVMGDSDTKILIGPENVSDALKDTSVVMASYDIGDGMRGSSAWWVPPDGLRQGHRPAELLRREPEQDVRQGETELPLPSPPRAPGAQAR